MKFVLLIVYIALIGLLVGGINYIFGEMLPAIAKRAIYFLFFVLVVFLVLNAFGLLPAPFTKALQ